MSFPTIESRARRRVATTALTLITVAVTATVTAHADDTDLPLGASCPNLYALGVQGSDEGTVTDENYSDTGALGQVFGPLTAAAGDAVARAYVPYGHGPDGAGLDYEAAVTNAAAQVERMAAEAVARCPDTEIAVAGYAQGAAAVARFAERVGGGESTVAPEHVAAVALLANPSRAADTPVLPGRPGATTPSAAPGTAGRQVAQISLLNQSLTGAGISVSTMSTPDYGALAGRVADLCVAGDATCDAPTGGTLASTVAGIAARSDLRDPVAAVSTIAEALATTVYTTAVDVVNDDLTGTSLDQLSYQPATPLAQRLAEAADPTATPPGPNEALAALFKVGTIGLNAVITVAQTVFTPAAITELAAIGMANPWAAIAALSAKLVTAVVELVPPHTASRWVNEAFDAITSTVTDHGELYTLAGTAQYSDTTGRHGSYRTAPATPTGRSALAATADWFTAIAHDLTAARPSRQPAASTTSSASTAPGPSTAIPTAPPSPSGGP